MCFSIADGEQEKIDTGYENEEASDSLLQPDEIYDPNTGMIMNLVQGNGDETDPLISLPLFRVSGTSMDMKRLYDKLDGKNPGTLKRLSYRPKSTSFGAQWKTRVG